MSTFGFGFYSFSSTSILGGSCTDSFQIPGTFGGLVPADPANGRYLKSALIWADVPVAGDAITLLQIVDTDGVVPVPVRALLPNYPVVFNLLDDSSTAMLPPGGLEIGAFDTVGNPATRFIPSQLYFKITFQTGGLTIGNVFRTVIRWGIWQ